MKLGLLVIVLFLSACSPRPKDISSVDQEVAAEPEREMGGQVAEKGIQTVLASTSLTVEEKNKIIEIHKRVAEDVALNRGETSKLLAVLFKTITTRPYNASKAAELEKRLLTLQNEKMRTMFMALDEVRKIVENTPEKELQEIYSPFLLETAKK